MSFTRRDLLSRGAALAASGLVAPSFIARTALALAQSTASPKGILVVVQLSGGNDGLNTLIPFTEPEYYQLRSSLAVPGTDVLPLTDRLGLHPQLGGFKSLYDQGTLAIVQVSDVRIPTARTSAVWTSGRLLGPTASSARAGSVGTWMPVNAGKTRQSRRLASAIRSTQCSGPTPRSCRRSPTSTHSRFVRKRTIATIARRNCKRSRPGRATRPSHPARRRLQDAQQQDVQRQRS
jgi:hypothetical protein